MGALSLRAGDFYCPGCGRLCNADYHGSGKYVLIHDWPACERFDKVETTADGAQFMKEARLKRTN
jgi:hypothetical protein